MIKVDADITASIREVDSKRFVTQLKDWQEREKDDYVIYVLDDVFDLFVDCCDWD